MNAPPPLSAAALAPTPPTRTFVQMVAEEHGGDVRAASAAQRERYQQERAAADAGWAAGLAGRPIEENPWFGSDARRLARSWADGHEKSRAFAAIVGAAINWFAEGQAVRVVRYERMDRKKLAGKEGVITTIHRGALFGSFIVTVPPQGRQRRPREAWFDLKNICDVEPA